MSLNFNFKKVFEVINGKSVVDYGAFQWSLWILWWESTKWSYIYSIWLLYVHVFWQNWLSHNIIMKYIYVIKPRKNQTKIKIWFLYLSFYKQRLSCEPSLHSAFYELPTYWTLSRGVMHSPYNNKDVLLCTDLTHP